MLAGRRIRRHRRRSCSRRVRLYDRMSVADNIARIQERIQSAAKRAGRDASQITLMAVSKTFPADSIHQAYDAGVRVFGENRVQEFAGKIDAVRDLARADWHLIGHLQTNKAAKAAELFHAG